jgi:hypothetical protein
MSKTSTLHEYARIGAGARLTELRAEMVALHRIFPDLGAAGARKRQGRPPGTAPTVTPKRKRRKISAAGRKAISDAQKKRWAKLKAEKKP